MDEYSAGDGSEAVHSPTELKDIAQKLAILAEEIKAITATPLTDTGVTSHGVESFADRAERRQDATGTGALPQP